MALHSELLQLSEKIGILRYNTIDQEGDYSTLRHVISFI